MSTLQLEKSQIQTAWKKTRAKKPSNILFDIEEIVDTGCRRCYVSVKKYRQAHQVFVGFDDEYAAQTEPHIAKEYCVSVFRLFTGSLHIQFFSECRGDKRLVREETVSDPKRIRKVEKAVWDIKNGPFVYNI